MTFEYPGFLYFLFLAFIPVIIHLFNLRKSKKVIFSNVRFLEQVKSASKSKTKVNRWLVLLSRVLFVIFLVFAFAQPHFGDKDQKVSNSKSKYIYIDNSLSMQIDNGKGNNLELVKNTLLNSIDKDAEYTILTNSQFSKRAKGNELEEYISSIGHTNLHKSLNTILDKLSSAPDDASVYVFSDFQRNFLKPEWLRDSIKYSTTLVPILNETVNNVYVDSIWLNVPFPQKDQLVKLYVSVKNSGNANAKSVAIKLLLNDFQQGATMVDIKSGENKVLTFDIVLNGLDHNVGKVVLEDGSAYFDNEFHLSLTTSNKIKVGLITEKSAPFLPLVFTDSLFEFTKLSLQAVQTSNLNGFDLIVLDELTNIPDFLIEKVVQSEVALMVFPSMEVSSKAGYESLMNALAINGVQFNYSDSISLTNEGNRLVPPEFENPFYQGMFEVEDHNMTMPMAQPLLSWNKSGLDLLKNKKGEPVFSYFNDKSELYLWAVPLSSSHSDIKTHSLFLPIMYKAAINSLDIEHRLYHTFGEHMLVYKGDFTNYRDKLKLFYNGKEMANAKVNDYKMLFELPSQNLPSGIFDVKTRDSLFYKAAINYVDNESVMKFYQTEELKDLFGNQSRVSIKPLEEFESELNAAIGNKDNTFPYWKICLILSLMFLMSETLLIRFNK